MIEVKKVPFELGEGPPLALKLQIEDFFEMLQGIGIREIKMWPGAAVLRGEERLVTFVEWKDEWFTAGGAMFDRGTGDLLSLGGVE